ncbi:MAG: alpha-glucan family phosphorylase [Spirochaetia bacterium]|nr:alpha-glucan family phosphorylase [Spirochaetia bacterium]
MVKRNYKQLKIKSLIPENLANLRQISNNFWFSWNPSISELFQSIDFDLWQKSQNNPYRMLIQLNSEKLLKLSNSKSFMSRLHALEEDYTYYFNRSEDEQRQKSEKSERIAYFCAEFALHESFPNYSGGLGVLAGDHIKTASDMNLPLVAIGLLYRFGYFSQYLNDDGWQQENYPIVDTFTLPLELVLDQEGNPVLVEIEMPGRKVFAQSWHCIVGKVDLYLLDTNISQNSFDDRKITNQLYVGDKEIRIQQEMILGVGGIRLLQKIDKYPTVVHMNEGHSAFSSLERIRYYIKEHKLSLIEAYELVKSNTVFTTHTPIPAGNEEFTDSLIEKYLQPFIEVSGFHLQEFLNLGRIHQNTNEKFGMTPFCIRSSAYCNGVSKLHGKVSRNLWREIWHELYDDEIPINYVTNGIHVPTWISDELSRLFLRYVDPQWFRKVGDPEIWSRIKNIPSNELWKASERLKERLISFTRKKIKESLIRKNSSRQEIEDTDNLLNADSLTIGFARRFATYKRAYLLFKDEERFKKILSSTTCPVQFIFAGKAHPADKEGKEVIARIIHIARNEGFKNRIVFLEDYDLESARYLVQGVDIWLNTPLRPMEACGTSGMKVAVNGGINLSIPDGWWDEAYTEDIGWTIGRGEEYKDHEYQDFVESKALYDILENTVIPAYFNRGADSLPKEWINKQKHSIAYTLSHFNSERMVGEYLQNYYNPASKTYLDLIANDFQKIREYGSWLTHLKSEWPNVKFISFSHKENIEYFHADETIFFEAQIEIGKLKPDDLKVSIFIGKEDSTGKIINEKSIDMQFHQNYGTVAFYTCSISPQSGGVFYYSTRIIPDHPSMVRKVEPDLVIWS